MMTSKIFLTSLCALPKSPIVLSSLSALHCATNRRLKCPLVSLTRSSTNTRSNSACSVKYISVFKNIYLGHQESCCLGPLTLDQGVVADLGFVKGGRGLGIRGIAPGEGPELFNKPFSYK